MKSLLTVAFVLMASATALAQESIVDLQREKVSLLKENLADFRRTIQHGAGDPRELAAAEQQLIEAQIELAELEGDAKKVVSLRRELVVQAQETLTYQKRQMDKGTISAFEVRKAEVKLIDCKIALAKAETAANASKK